MNVISGTVLKAVMPVSEEQFKAERLYLMSLSVAESMLQKGIISEDEFSEIDTILLGICRVICGHGNIRHGHGQAQ